VSRFDADINHLKADRMYSFGETVLYQPHGEIGSPEMSVFPKLYDLADIVNSFNQVWAESATAVGSSGILTDFDTSENLSDAFHQDVVTNNGITRLFMQLDNVEFAQSDYVSVRVPKVPNTFPGQLKVYNLCVEGNAEIISDPAKLISAYSAAKDIVPNAKVGVSIQYDQAIADGNLRTLVEWMDTNMDVLMISTHPGAADPTTADPLAFAFDYFAPVRAISGKELIVAETGWPNSFNVQHPVTSMTGIHAAMRQLNYSLISVFSRRDLDLLLNPAFRFYGLYQKDGTAYPAASTWTSLHAQFTPTTTTARVKLLQDEFSEAEGNGLRTTRRAAVVLDLDDVPTPSFGDRLVLRNAEYRIVAIDQESSIGEAVVDAVFVGDQEYTEDQLRRSLR
jgi:hypothetical protein